MWHRICKEFHTFFEISAKYVGTYNKVFIGKMHHPPFSDELGALALGMFDGLNDSLQGDVTTCGGAGNKKNIG